MEPDIDRLRSWIGRAEERSDLLTPRLAEAFDATLDEPARAYRGGEEAPLGIHWCIGTPAVRASGLGRDGHPKREGFMPPVPLPRRMWASGDVVFHAPLSVGSEVTRSSTIRSIDEKRGRSGTLIFVVIEHRYSQDGEARVTEAQTLVFREDPQPGQASPTPTSPGRPDRVVRTLVPDAVMLFRYSALTFNGHRIHYDEPYAREVEGYDGLVVHGPLQATLLMNAAAVLGDGVPRLFRYRGLRPLTHGGTFEVCAARRADGSVESWTRDAAGRACMEARSSWAGMDR